MLYVITGNAGKFREIHEVIPDTKQLGLDLDEIQSLDPQVVIQHKLNQAALHHDGEFIVEDTSLTFDCLGGLPGTLIKWFQNALDLDGLASLAASYPDQAATARTVIGYRDKKGENRYFVGEVRGRIVDPRGAGGFGWDDIFLPDGSSQTFSELGPKKKNELSMRRIAVEKLKTHLQA